jgi:hypothetical protein
MNLKFYVCFFDFFIKAAVQLDFLLHFFNKRCVLVLINTPRRGFEFCQIFVMLVELDISKNLLPAFNSSDE